MILLRLCATLALCAALTGYVTAQPDERLRVVTAPVDIGAQVFYAEDLGLFKKAQLNVAVSTMTNGAAIVSGLVSGAFDIAQTNIVSLAQAHERGIPLVIVAPAGIYSSRNPTTMLAVPANSPIRSAEDLNGKTIAVPGVRSIAEVTAEAWIDKNGGNSQSVKFLELPFSAMPEALKSGRIDAAVLVDPVLGHAVADGIAKVLAPIYDATADEFLIAAYVSTKDFARTHASLVRRFSSVMLRAGAWANAHNRDSARILEKETKIELPPGASRVTYPTSLTPALVQPLIDVAAKYKALKSTFPASQLFQ